MLKDRRALLEQDIRKAHEEASNLYLHIVTTDGDVHNPEYQLLRDRASKLQFDLNIVNDLIARGHE